MSEKMPRNGSSSRLDINANWVWRSRVMEGQARKDNLVHLANAGCIKGAIWDVKMEILDHISPLNVTAITAQFASVR